MPKDKNPNVKVNFFNIKVSPVVFFILDFILTVAFLLLLDWIWSKIANEEFKFGIFGNVILPLILSIAGTLAMVSNAKKEKEK